MRYICVLFLALVLISCSSEKPATVPQHEISDSRVLLSDYYSENDYHYVDIRVENVSNLYQFSLRLEYDPDYIEIIGFTPSFDFDPEPLVLHQRIGKIPEHLRSDMLNIDSELYAIAVTRPFPNLGDIENPNLLGQVQFKSKCTDPEDKIRIFDHKDFIVFRDHKRNAITINPVHPRIHDGGGR